MAFTSRLFGGIGIFHLVDEGRLRPDDEPTTSDPVVKVRVPTPKRRDVNAIDYHLKNSAIPEHATQPGQANDNLFGLPA